MAKIGDLISNVTATASAAQASQEAAVAADQKAASDQATAEAAETKLGAAIKKVGPVTVSNPDGTFATYTTSTADPGYRVETSHGVETDVPDDSGSTTDPTPTPAPSPDPTPAPVEPTPAPTASVDHPDAPAVTF